MLKRFNIFIILRMIDFKELILQLKKMVREMVSRFFDYFKSKKRENPTTPPFEEEPVVKEKRIPIPHWLDYNSIIYMNCVHFVNKQITNMKKIECYQKMSILRLDRNKIRKIEGFVNYKHRDLKKLILTRNEIAKIENLDGLTSLVELYLGENRIREMENLDGLKNLQVLHLGNNIEWSRLKSTKVDIHRTMDLGQGFYEEAPYNNQICRIQGLRNLKCLIYFNINYNCLEKIEGLNNQTELERFYAEGNQISKIENLGCLKNLEELNLNKNKICKIENLHNKNKLKHVSFCQNYITKIEKLPINTFLCVYLDDNPILYYGKEKICKYMSLNNTYIFKLDLHEIKFIRFNKNDGEGDFKYTLI
jgi:hypothetical protein